MLINEYLPMSLKAYKNLRYTIDCIEVFIDRPRDLEIQEDYKKHNTIKFPVGIAPNGMIANFLSKAWGGRASHQHITKASGFLHIPEPGDLILADR